MIAFQIQIPANASTKDVANAIKIRAQLLEAGVSENMVASVPSIARAASPSVASGKGANQLAWEAENGRSRFTVEMLNLAIATLPSDEQGRAAQLSRDEQIGIFAKQVNAGKIVRTQQGYKSANGGNGNGRSIVVNDDSETSAEEIDPNEVV